MYTLSNLFLGAANRITRSTTDHLNLCARPFHVILKRGAWGADHCVVENEDRDMMDKGSWPVLSDVDRFAGTVMHARTQCVSVRWAGDEIGAP